MQLQDRKILKHVIIYIKTQKRGSLLKKKILTTLVFISFLSAGTIYGYHKLNTPDTIIEVHSLERDFPTVDVLYDNSEIVVKGKVLNEEVKTHTFVEDDGEQITEYYTEREFKIQKVYKGANVKSGEIIIVRSSDAKTNTIVQESSASISNNKSYALFLKTSKFPEKTGAFTFVGGAQGIFSLEKKEMNHKYKEIQSLKKLEEKIEKIKTK